MRFRIDVTLAICVLTAWMLALKLVAKLPAPAATARVLPGPFQAARASQVSLSSLGPNVMPAARLPAFFLAHGGGPMPLLGDPSHRSLIEHWKQLKEEIATQLKGDIKAVLVVSAHWESEGGPTVTNWVGPRPLLFDYYNFPQEAYSFTYDAPGNPQLAQRIISLLKERGIEGRTDGERGFDHGVFVPLLSLMPEADVPVLAMSLVSSLDPKEHIEIGRALAPLRDEGVLIIGSGLSFHSMRALMSGQGGSKAKDFDDFLQNAVTSSPAERESKLANWLSAPHARFCHPREDHLVPLFVAAGAAPDGSGKIVFSDRLMGASVSSFQFD